MNIRALRKWPQMAALVTRLDQVAAGWHAPLFRFAMNHERRFRLRLPGRQVSPAPFHMLRHCRLHVVNLAGVNTHDAGSGHSTQAYQPMSLIQTFRVHEIGCLSLHYVVTASATRTRRQALLLEATAYLRGREAFKEVLASDTPCMIIETPDGGSLTSEGVPASTVLQ